MTRNRALLLLSALFAALALVAVGCGGSSDGSSASADTTQETETLETDTTETDTGETDTTETNTGETDTTETNTSETDTTETNTSETDTGETDTTETDTGDTDTTETEASSGDTGAVPPPGQATLDVDGKTFVFYAKDTISERLLECEVSEEVVTINFQTDGYDDITIQARPVDGVWLGNITAVPREANGTYSVGSLEVTIDGQSAVFKGAFTFTPDENRADFQDVGEGRVAVTCS